MAGNPRRSSRQEHPRVCGENRVVHLGFQRFGGTSPRMRGKHADSGDRRGRTGNIPAYAGKTSSTPVKQSVAPEHPRVCGENLLKTQSLSLSIGTSPRMRGKLSETKVFPNGDRNIPAYAGKTWRHSRKPQCLTGTSPRMRGKPTGLRRHSLSIGTSPRMRGKLSETKVFPNGDRNIPAYAGKTWRHSRKPQCLTGTSPRMRGKPTGLRRHSLVVRNIPAYAGKTASSGVIAMMMKEHPRVCGENDVY